MVRWANLPTFQPFTLTAQMSLCNSVLMEEERIWNRGERGPSQVSDARCPGGLTLGGGGHCTLSQSFFSTFAQSPVCASASDLNCYAFSLLFLLTKSLIPA